MKKGFTMPTTRRSQKEQRLSDFFPAVNAPSPIVASARRAMRSNASATIAITRDTPRQSARKQPRLQDNVSTPVFDPEVHCRTDEDSLDSEEDAFVKSLHFSAAKSRTKGTPMGTSKIHDYEVMVDYDSDSDSFAFSPVKFTPGNSERKPIRRANGTPAPTARLRQASKMVWNSVTKKIEEQMVSLVTPQGARNLAARISTPAARAVLSGSSSDESDDNEEQDEDGFEQHDTHENCYDMGTVVPATDQPATELVSQNSSPDTSRKFDRTISKSGPCINANSTSASSVNNSNLGAATTHDGVPVESPQVLVHRAPPIQAPLPRNSKLGRKTSAASTRSPRIHLTRAVSGSLTVQKLDKIPLPEYILSSENDTLRKQSMRPKTYARLPKKIPTTVPKPFALSKARSKVPQTQHENSVQATEMSEDAQQTAVQVDRVRMPLAIAKKRKMSDEPPESTGLRSPAKRVKVDDTRARVIAPLRGTRNKLKPVSAVPAFEFSSEAMLKKRTMERELKLRRQAEEEARNRRPPEAGVVPRTLYSPEKQFRMNKVASATKPQPFKFSTEARAARSPSVSTPVVARKPSVARTSNALRVPVLEAAPFIPKPSTHPATVAASPARKLPSRLEVRREFDKVAERHAEEVMERRRRDEQNWALERERRIEERKGWKDSGQAAIEQWAATRAKVTEKGRRDWVD